MTQGCFCFFQSTAGTSQPSIPTPQMMTRAAARRAAEAKLKAEEETEQEGRGKGAQ